MGFMIRLRIRALVAGLHRPLDEHEAHGDQPEDEQDRLEDQPQDHQRRTEGGQGRPIAGPRRAHRGKGVEVHHLGGGLGIGVAPGGEREPLDQADDPGGQQDAVAEVITDPALVADGDRTDEGAAGRPAVEGGRDQADDPQPEEPLGADRDHRCPIS
jgi:hypothetical protein